MVVLAGDDVIKQLDVVRFNSWTQKPLQPFCCAAWLRRSVVTDIAATDI